MTISFDLDDTLYPCSKSFDFERISLFQNITGVERVRLGTKNLIKLLQKEGHKVFIYTTSYRSIAKIKWTFFTYGIQIDRVINQQVHNKTLKQSASDFSKYPPAFDIDVHIDDSKGVQIEGFRYGFKTIIIAPENPTWTNDIQQALAGNMNK